MTVLNRTGTGKHFGKHVGEALKIWPVILLSVNFLSSISATFAEYGQKTRLISLNGLAWLGKTLWPSRTAKRLQRPRQHKLIKRKSDGSFWVAGSPQNFGLAMSGLFSGDRDFHFYKTRNHDGRWIFSPRIFWQAMSGEFEIVGDIVGRGLPKWPEEIETAKITASKEEIVS